MSKSIVGKLVNISGYKVVLELDEQIDIEQLKKYSAGKQPQIELVINDGRSISNEQRGKIFAIFNDMADYTGYSMTEIEELMKYRYMLVMKHPKMFHFGLPDPCSKSFAAEFLTFLIDYCIKEDIPFKTKLLMKSLAIIV